MFSLEKITRRNILELKPYSSARSEYSGRADIWLDANENPFDTELNRYPDPYQKDLKRMIAEVKGVKAEQIFVGNGSDEAIDLLFRTFCEPQKDKAYIFPPTYGMYVVSAKINNVEIVELELTANFELPALEEFKGDIQSNGLLFICSPNNPTGGIYSLQSIQEIANAFRGLVVVDEAYIDFAETESALSLLSSTPNLVVLQTMSKAFGLAGLRLGMAFASPEIIALLNKVKPPYNVNTLSQLKAIESLKNIDEVREQVAEIKSQRAALILDLKENKWVTKVYPTQTNFILAVFENAQDVFEKLRSRGIVIRNRTSEVSGGLRITVGTAAENEKLLSALKEITS